MKIRTRKSLRVAGEALDNLLIKMIKEQFPEVPEDATVYLSRIPYFSPCQNVMSFNWEE